MAEFFLEYEMFQTKFL